MSQIASIGLFFISVFVLIKSSSVVVARLSRIAYFLQLSEFAVSFVLVAFATSLPDLFVGVGSALHGRPELSFANVIGANILKFTVAVGIAAIIARGLAVKRGIVRKDALYASFAAFLPAFMLLDKSISRVDGLLLLVFFFWYFLKVSIQQERFTKLFTNTNHSLFHFSQFIRDLGVFFVALLFVIVSAEALIRSALALASNFDISLSIIGMILVGTSTTLPEIAFAIRAVMMGHPQMVLGGLIGSVVMNSGLTMGLTTVITPLTIQNFHPFLTGIIFTLIVAIVFALFVSTHKKVSMLEGVLLIALYIIFAAFLFAQTQTA